jgi:aquaporin related protein
MPSIAIAGCSILSRVLRLRAHLHAYSDHHCRLDDRSSIPAPLVLFKLLSHQELFLDPKFDPDAMSSTHANDHDSGKRHSNASQLPTWRRKLRRIKLPILPIHNQDGNRDLKVTTSKGHVYLLDQFRERVPLRIRNRCIAMISEFVGTFFFMLIGLGGNSAVINDPAAAAQFKGGDASANPAKILFIATVWAVSVTVNTWSFFRISGGLFNPAVTMALMLIRAVPPLDGLLDIFSQLAGSILASAIAYGLLPPGALAATTLGENTTVTQGLFIEMFITAQVVIAVFMLATEKHRATFIAPVGIGLAVFACILMYVFSISFPCTIATSIV